MLPVVLKPGLPALMVSAWAWDLVRMHIPFSAMGWHSRLCCFKELKTLTQLSTDNIQSGKTFQISLCTILLSQSPAVGHYHIVGITQTTAQRILAISFLDLLNFVFWISPPDLQIVALALAVRNTHGKTVNMLEVCCSSSILLQGESFDEKHPCPCLGVHWV